MTSKQETNEMAFQYKLVSVVVVVVFCLAVCAISGSAQTTGNSSLSGVVADPSGAVVPGATIEIHNPVSQFDRSTTTDGAGRFSFPNVPFNPYHLSVKVTGFAAYSQDVDVRSAVPLALKITLQIAGSAESVTVQGEASDLLENDPTFHSDLDRSLFDKVPLESSSSELSSLVTLASPGVAADSNGLFHGLGDHAENSFSLDGGLATQLHSSWQLLWRHFRRSPAAKTRTRAWCLPLGRNLAVAGKRSVPGKRGYRKTGEDTWAKRPHPEGWPRRYRSTAFLGLPPSLPFALAAAFLALLLDWPPI